VVKALCFDTLSQVLILNSLQHTKIRENGRTARVRTPA
jgi:hypothetical protein